MSGLELETTEPTLDLLPYMQFSHGTAADPDTMRAAFYAGHFERKVTADRFEGNHAAELWGAVEISSTQDVIRRALVELPLASEVDVYRYDASGRWHILRYSIFRPFEDVQHAGARLKTQPLSVPAGTSALLLFHFKFGPLQELSVTLEDEAELAQAVTSDVAKWSGFYAFAVAAIFVFVAYFAALRDVMSLLYAILFLTALAFLAYLDGLLFRYLYPNTPQLQSVVGFFLFLGIAAFGYALAGLGFRQQGAHCSMKIAWFLVGGCISLFPISLIFPGPFVAFGAIVLLIGMCVAVAIGTRLPAATTVTSMRVARGISLLVFAGVLWIFLPLILPFIPAPFGTLDAAKTLYLVIILSGLANLSAQIIAVRRARETAQEAEIAALRREAALSQRLVGSEKDYAHAQALAAQRQHRLATAAHDIRQPLKALRLRLDSLAGALTNDAKERLREALDYIDRLTAGYMDDDSTDAPPKTPEEVYDLEMVLTSVHRMFAPEAVEKGLDLRIVPTSQRTGLPAAPLMRIACNLVVNAIRHTHTGGVVLGVRRRKGRVWLCVADTGPGFPETEFERLKLTGVAGEASDGHGLGLAVCVDLAQRMGIELEVRSIPGRGSVFYLSLPNV